MSLENQNKINVIEPDKVKFKENKIGYILKLTKMAGKFFYDSKRKMVFGRQPLDWSN